MSLWAYKPNDACDWILGPVEGEKTKLQLAEVPRRSPPLEPVRLCGIAKKKAAESVKKAVADAQRAGADVRLVRVHVGTKSWESLKAAMAQVQFDLQKEQAWRFRLQHEVKTLNGWWEQARDRENKLNGTIQEMQQTSVEKDIEYQKLFHLYQKTREELDSQIKKCNDKLPASEGVVGITWP